MISERMNLKYSVERLPADTQRQIKSFTVESKGLSLSLHKHEADGGEGMQWMWASFDNHRQLRRANCVIYPSASAVTYKRRLKLNKIALRPYVWI